MIKRLKYNEINFQKYKNCLENSVQRKYSATQEFLDITSGKQWDLLVLNDYEAVMPIPFVRKFWIKFVHNSKLCQQLGVFSKEDSAEINELFLNELNKKYFVWFYGFNDGNQFFTKLKTRKNFLIFPDDYPNIYQKYSPKRKRKIRQEPEIKENSEIKENLDFVEVKKFIQENMRGADHHSKDAQDFIKILQLFFENGFLKLNGYFYHQKLINVIAVYQEEKTLALLGTYNHPEFIKISGASVLIDEILKQNISEKIFDFEGGEVANIEEFFRGFRPELKPYPYIRNSKKELLRKMVRFSF